MNLARVVILGLLVVILVVLGGAGLSTYASPQQPPSPLPGRESELVVVETPLRITLISDKLGKPVGDLKDLSNSDILSLIEAQKEPIGVKVLTRGPAVYDEPMWYTQIVSEIAEATENSDKTIREMSDEGLSVLLENDIVADWFTPEATIERHLPIIHTGTAPEPSAPWTPPNLGEFESEIQARLTAAQGVISQLYPEHSGRITTVCPSFDSSIPIWGQDFSANTGQEVVEVDVFAIGGPNATIQDVVIGDTFSFATYVFDRGDGAITIWADQRATDEGTTISVSIRENTSTHYMSLFLAEHMIAENVSAINIPYSVEISLPKGQFLPSAGYRLREGCTAGGFFGAQIGDYTRSFGSWVTLRRSGLSDIASSIHGYITDPEALFNPDMFTDCQAGVNNYRPVENRGGMIRLAVRSDVCLSVPAYILWRQNSPGGLARYAVAVLNMHGDPDILVPWPGPRRGQTTPRKIARHIEKSFDFRGEKTVTEAVSLFEIGILEIMLCYDYEKRHDSKSCSTLEEIVPLAARLQVSGTVPTLEYGDLARPDCTGCFIRAYREVNGNPALVVGYPSRSLFGIREAVGVIPTDLETQMAGVQFLLTLRNRLHPDATEPPWIPPDRIVGIVPGEQWIAFPTNSGETFQDFISETGVHSVCSVVQGNETCLPNQTITPNLGYKVTSSEPGNYRLRGTTVPEDTHLECPIGPRGTLCAAPVYPLPYAMLKASDMAALARNAGCLDVQISMLLPDGKHLAFPETDFQILKGIGYLLTSSAECTLVWDSNVLFQIMSARIEVESN